MRAAGSVPLVALAVLLCASGGGAASGGLARSLEKAIAESGARHGVHLLTECTFDGPMESVEVWGSGVGVWNRSRQFELAQERVTKLLEAFVAADFAEMPESFGGREPLEPPSRKGEEDAASEVICLVRLDLEGSSKTVFQLRKGEQSAELRGLAETLYRITAESARHGVEASDLGDGLRKLAAGELAPEAFTLLLHRRPESGEPAGFLLRVKGDEVTTREIASDGTRGATLREVLSAAEVQGLAAELAAGQPDRLPPNLWAPQYTDLALEVLNHRLSLQARPFVGMTPSTHGERQKGFDHIFATLERLHQSVQGAHAAP